MRAGNLAVISMAACLIAIGRWDLAILCIGADFAVWSITRN